MSNQFPSSINPAQLNPAVLQAFAAAQQASGGQLGSGNPNAVQAFNTFHSAFRKLQSAESQRLDQERLGITMPPQQQQQQQQNGLQGMSQQQFLQMMQQAGMMQQNGNTGASGGNDQSMMGYNMTGQQGMGGMNGMNGMNGVNGMNNASYGNMGMPNMPNVAATMGGNMGTMNTGNMPNMSMGNAAANAFNIHSSQQGLNLPGMPENEQGRRQMLQNMLSQQLQNPQQAQQGQSQPNQQYVQPQQPNQNAALTQQIREFASKNPQAIADISRRVGDNQQALLAELTQMVASSQSLAPQQPQQLRQPSFNLDQMQQTYPAPSPQSQHHQRMGSTDSYQFQGMPNSSMPNGAMQGAASIDYSKLDAAMKTARMVTPQMSANSLPLVSPNNSINQVTPQMQAQQLQQPQPLAPPPVPQRSSSQSVITGNSSATDVQAMIQTWGDKQLLKSTESLVSKINVINQNPNTGTPLDPSRYHLLQIIAEWKRRGQKPPEFALACAVQILGNPGVGAQLQHSDWATLANFAKARVDASNNGGRPDQQPPRQSSGSQTNPIDMITPTLNATPQLGHQPLVPNAFQTPVNQPTGLQPAAPIAERQNSRGQQQQPQQPLLPPAPHQQTQQAQLQAQQQAQLQQAQQQAAQHAQQIQQQSLQQQQQAAQQQQQLQLQQANQQVQQWQQQQALQAQQAQAQQQQGQLQPIDPSPQQSRSSPLSNNGVPPAVAKSKPWLAMDFSKENIPIKEEPFMMYLGNMHMKSNEPLPAPMIEGKPVNLFNLFGLIHRNGGSTRVANNTQVWTFIGGMLGFGGEQTQQGQPTRSTPQVANQLRQMYAKFVAPLEDMFYAKLWRDKMKAAQQQQQQQAQQQSGLPTPNINLGRQLPPGAQGMSAQFLEAVAQVPGATLTDSQRKTLDEARRQSQSSASISTPPNPAQLTPAQPPMTPRSIHSAQMANNPAMVFQWVKIREDGTRSKFPKDAKNITEEDKPKVIMELRGMLPAAREAQEKMPRFLMLAADRARDEITTLGTLVSMYMFVFLALQYSETGRFPFGIDDLGKIRDSLQNILLKFNNLFKQVASTPEGQLQIQRMNELLDSARPQSTSMPPPSSVAEDIASKLPKGLRVEDLKPPPAKRQKGAAGKASPSAATPEAKTPLGDSPAPPGSASSKKGGKRKRQESTSKPTMPQPVAARTPILPPPPPPPPAKGNALGINLDVVEAEIQEHAPFFAAYNALRAPLAPADSAQIPTLDLSGSDEIWTQLIDAINGFQADPANHSVANAEITSALNPMSTLNVNVNALPAGPSRPTSTAAGEDDWFEKFIDVSKVDESAPAWTLPTPELFRVGSRDDDDDTSPESIKTVGSTTGMNLKTPVISNTGLETGEKEQVPVLGGFGSPEGAAYNGVFFGWDESSYNFVAAQ